MSLQSVSVDVVYFDCLGLIDGPAIADPCGVCDGDGSSCLDCASIANGGASLDSCGVCGGDGSCNVLPEPGSTPTGEYASVQLYSACGLQPAIYLRPRDQTLQKAIELYAFPQEEPAPALLRATSQSWSTSSQTREVTKLP